MTVLAEIAPAPLKGGHMKRFIEGEDRHQVTLLSE